MGIEDDETWVNLLAQHYPDVEFLNYGRPVFAAENVLRSYNAYPADAYIWLIVDNDDFPVREYYPVNESFEITQLFSNLKYLNLYKFYYSKSIRFW